MMTTDTEHSGEELPALPVEEAAAMHFVFNVVTSADEAGIDIPKILQWAPPVGIRLNDMTALRQAAEFSELAQREIEGEPTKRGIKSLSKTLPPAGLNFALAADTLARILTDRYISGKELRNYMPAGGIDPDMADIFADRFLGRMAELCQPIPS